MAFALNTYNTENNVDEGLQNILDTIDRTDPRGPYYIEPTWCVNGVPISQCVHPNLPQAAIPTRRPIFEIPAQPRKPTFKHCLRSLRSSELREIIMNFCLKSLNVHKDVIEILKQMQRSRPRPISLSERVQNPTAGLYLYCRTQRELVDIVLEISRNDETGYCKQDIKDLIMVMKEKEG